MLAPDLRYRQCFEAIGLPARGIGAGADEGQINFSILQQFINFTVGLALDKLYFMAQLVGDKIQQLMIIDHGFFGRNHGCHGNTDYRTLLKFIRGLIYDPFLGKINKRGLLIA